MNVTGGSTDVTTYFALRLAADGTEATGLTVTNFDLQYVRSGAAPSAKVDATALAATDSAHSDNKAIEIDATDQPGLYRVDWPDAAFAAGVKEVILTVKCATAFTEHLRVQIDPPANVTSLNANQQSLTDLKDFADTGYDPSAHKVAGVVLVDTLTTYTGNTVQTGDSFARIGATGSGLTSLAPSATALSTAQWTNARAGYLDNINNATLAGATFPSDPADQSLVIAATNAIVALIGSPAGASLSADVAAVAAKTGSLTFTVANKLDVNVLYVNGTQIDGAGTEGDPWGPV